MPLFGEMPISMRQRRLKDVPNILSGYFFDISSQMTCCLSYRKIHPIISSFAESEAIK